MNHIGKILSGQEPLIDLQLAALDILPKLEVTPLCNSKSRQRAALLCFEINPTYVITQTSIDSAVMLAALSLDLESGKFTIQTDDANFVD